MLSRFLITALFASLFLGCSQSPTSVPRVTSLPPPVTVELQTVGGSAVSVPLQRFTLIHFWATWCPTCLGELPSFETLGPMLKKGEIDLLLIAIDTPLEALQEMQKRHPLTIPLFRDYKREARTRFSISGLPVTILVNPSGEPIPLYDPDSGALSERIIGPRQSWGTIRTASRIHSAVVRGKEAP